MAAATAAGRRGCCSSLHDDSEDRRTDSRSETIGCGWRAGQRSCVKSALPVRAGGRLTEREGLTEGTVVGGLTEETVVAVQRASEVNGVSQVPELALSPDPLLGILLLGMPCVLVLVNFLPKLVLRERPILEELVPNLRPEAAGGVDGARESRHPLRTMRSFWLLLLTLVFLVLFCGLRVAGGMGGGGAPWQGVQMRNRVMQPQLPLQGRRGGWGGRRREARVAFVA